MPGPATILLCLWAHCKRQLIANLRGEKAAKSTWWGVFRPHWAVRGDYSCLRVRGSVLAVFGDPYGSPGIRLEIGLATCKSGALLLQLQRHMSGSRSKEQEPAAPLILPGRCQEPPTRAPFPPGSPTRGLCQLFKAELLLQTGPRKRGFLPKGPLCALEQRALPPRSRWRNLTLSFDSWLPGPAGQCSEAITVWALRDHSWRF